jgi:hypothetical protein
MVLLSGSAADGDWGLLRCVIERCMYRTIRVARSPDKMFLHDVVTEVVHVNEIIDHVAATHTASPGPLTVTRARL